MPASEFEFEGPDGQKYYTGNILPETLPLSFQPYPVKTLRPLGEIAEILKNPKRKKRRELFGQDKLINQGQRSSCNAYMAAAMLMRAIFYTTGKWVDVSPEFIYMHINGGRDNGSGLAEGMEFCTDVGSCKLLIGGERLIPYQSYRKNEISMEHMRVCTADAANQRFCEAYQFDNGSVEQCFHGMLDCLAGGGVIGMAVHVGNSYMRSGEVAGFDNGPGNHAICGDDIVMLTDNPKSIQDFRIVSPQSWGTKFADQGWTQITWRHIEKPMNYHGMYGVRTSTISEDDMSKTRLKAA